MAPKQSWLARKVSLGTGGGAARAFSFYLGLVLLAYMTVHMLVIIIYSFINLAAWGIPLALIICVPLLVLTARDPRPDEEGEETEEAEEAEEAGPAVKEEPKK